MIRNRVGMTGMTGPGRREGHIPMPGRRCLDQTLRRTGGPCHPGSGAACPGWRRPSTGQRTGPRLAGCPKREG
ncbi:hypothetical protein B0O80DRAFT_453165 [Mortierella sp. GBAus27b]|nr:hypothetical protein B0O80DRAFT_453165 [Mortierella sp. GBAus27b]